MMVNIHLQNTLVIVTDPTSLELVSLDCFVPALPFGRTPGIGDEQLPELTKYLVSIIMSGDSELPLAVKNRNYFGLQKFLGVADIRDACGRVLGGM